MKVIEKRLDTVGSFLPIGNSPWSKWKIIREYAHTHSQQPPMPATVNMIEL